MELTLIHLLSDLIQAENVKDDPEYKFRMPNIRKAKPVKKDEFVPQPKKEEREVQLRNLL